jgi:hypothetical protein
MYRILLLLSLLPIAAALAARWWFGLRVLAGRGTTACRCDAARWQPPPEVKNAATAAGPNAARFGRQLRLIAMADWRLQDPKAHAARESSRRFGIAVPPLSAVVAVFAVLAGRMPALGAVAVVAAACALAATFALLSLAPELRAIARGAHKLRQQRVFAAADEEDAVVECAAAAAWDECLPPALRWLQR